jgi:hypothetical protein
MNYTVFSTLVLWYKSKFFIFKSYVGIWQENMKVIPVNYRKINFLISSSLVTESGVSSYEFITSKNGLLDTKQKTYTLKARVYFYNGETAPSGPGPLITEAWRSHLDTPHYVRLLWTSDRSVAETSTWQHTTLRRDRPMLPAGFEPAIPTS